MDTIKKEIQEFLKLTSMTPTRFGRLSVRDPRLWGDLNRGRQFADRTLRRIRLFIKTYIEENIKA